MLRWSSALSDWIDPGERTLRDAEFELSTKCSCETPSADGLAKNSQGSPLRKLAASPCLLRHLAICVRPLELSVRNMRRTHDARSMTLPLHHSSRLSRQTCSNRALVSPVATSIAFSPNELAISASAPLASSKLTSSP